MTHPALLTKKEFVIEGNWYSALNRIRQYKSVAKIGFYDTGSSAGDWSGYIVQFLNNHSYLILFSQENNYPRGGFTVWTDDNILASWKGKLSEDDIFNIISENTESLYTMEE